jgi:hypothetical protein
MNNLPEENYIVLRESLFERDKEDWIYLYGSEALQLCFLSGSVCEDKYIEERIDREYPGFKVSSPCLFKPDLPCEYDLKSLDFSEYSYCGSCESDSYLIIDNYLGKYTIVKKINSSKERELHPLLFFAKTSVTIVMILFLVGKLISVFDRLNPELSSRLKLTINHPKNAS